MDQNRKVCFRFIFTFNVITNVFIDVSLVKTEAYNQNGTKQAVRSDWLQQQNNVCNL